MTIRTPARVHYERALAARAAADAAPGEAMTGGNHTLRMLARDQAALRAVQSVSRKVELKRKMLPEYAAYIDGVLSAGRGAQDEVLVTVMIWRIDVADYDGALAIAEYAFAHGLKAPARFDRSLAAIVVEQVADAALASSFDGEPFDPVVLLRIQHMTDGDDMHDQVRAKLCRALGESLKSEDPAAALANFRAAVKYNDRIGVKKQIDQLEKLLEADSRDASGDDGK